MIWKEYIKENQFDIIGITETKTTTNKEKHTFFKDDTYITYWSSNDEPKGGVGIMIHRWLQPYISKKFKYK
ncbi:11835_t:CDS:1, partial [Entrophospora sp. SA101]